MKKAHTPIWVLAVLLLTVLLVWALRRPDTPSREMATASSDQRPLEVPAPPQPTAPHVVEHRANDERAAKTPSQPPAVAKSPMPFDPTRVYSQRANQRRLDLERMSPAQRIAAVEAMANGLDGLDVLVVKQLVDRCESTLAFDSSAEARDERVTSLLTMRPNQAVGDAEIAAAIASVNGEIALCKDLEQAEIADNWSLISRAAALGSDHGKREYMTMWITEGVIDRDWPDSEEEQGLLTIRHAHILLERRARAEAYLHELVEKLWLSAFMVGFDAAMKGTYGAMDARAAYRYAAAVDDILTPSYSYLEVADRAVAEGLLPALDPAERASALAQGRELAARYRARRDAG